MRSIDTAGGRPREILDESSAFPIGVAPSIDEQSQAAFDLAGIAQTGALPFAPTSAGGTLGMAVKPKGGNWVNNNLDRVLASYSENDPEHVQNWVNTKLKSYLRNDMGTIEDPIRLIADEWPAKQNKLLAPQLNKRDKLQDLISKYEIEPTPTGLDNPEAWRAARIRSSQRDLDEVNDEIERVQNYNPLHYTPSAMANYFTSTVKDRRVRAGYPAEGIAKSELGKRWELDSDSQIKPDTVDVLKMFGNSYTDNDPYLKNAPGDTPVYLLHSSENLGFDRIADGLRKSSDPNSKLPPELRIPVEKLNRISVPQAVEHIAKLDDWEAQQQAIENMKLSRNEAVFEHKQYPGKNLSWVEIKNPKKTIEYDDLNEYDQDYVYKLARRTARSEGLDPESDDFRFRMTGLMSELANKKYNEDLVGKALKYEGDRMNHCVGSYCDTVSRGDTRVFSLRNNKGEPHVTVQTKPVEEGLYYDRLMNSLPNDEQSKLTVDAYDYNAKNPHLGYKESVIGLMKDRYGPPTEDLRQVYGKNDEPVSEKYLPLVHDFMRSHPGLDVNTVDKGLRHVGVHDIDSDELTALGVIPGTDMYKEARKRFGEWVSPEELKSLISSQGYAGGGEVSMEDLPFNDPDQLRLYHQAMKHYDDVIENTGGSKKIGKSEARVNYTTTTKGDREHDKNLHTLIADYGLDLGNGANVNATMIKPVEAEGVYLGNLSGSVPVGEGRASIGLQGLHTKYNDGLSGYTAGYTGKVGGGDLNASYFEPADHKSEGRQIQVEYNMPFSKGGSVTSQQENLYHRAMVHYDNLMAA